MRTRSVAALAVLALGGFTAQAQNVISAKSGIVHYVEGRVYIADKLVETKFGNFPEVKENAVLRTEDGRAEVLLTPGVFLRVSENSSFRMITNRLIDTRLEVLSGSTVLEADEIAKDNSVTIVAKDATIHLNKKGIYRIDAEPWALRVFEGEAAVQSGERTVEVGGGKMIALTEMAVAKFDKDAGDALDRWSRRRGEYIAMANISAAKMVSDSGMTWASSAWRWNPYFGAFTFIPMRGSFFSPYGFMFWSPATVYRVYQPRPVYVGSGWNGMNAGRGYSTVGPTMGGYSGTVASSAPSVHAPTSSSAGAASAPVSRGGGSAGGGRR